MEQIEQITPSDFHSICRTCMDHLTESRHDIFESPDLKAQLILCTSLPVKVGDGFPKSMCQPCYQKLSELYAFNQMCLASMQRCQTLMDRQKDLQQEELALTMKETKQELDDIIFAEFQELIEMEPTEIKPNNDSVIQEPKEDALQSEEESSNDQEGNISEEPEEKKAPETVSEGKSAWRRDNKRFPCPQCNKTFTRPYRVRHHVRSVHERKQERLSCTEEGCDRTYSLKQTLQKHLREVHGRCEPEKPKNPNSYICEDCGKVLSSLFTLKNHRYMHTGQELPYACTECGKRHLTKHKLKDHMNRHKGIKNYVCPHCGARKTTRTELNVHINYHTKEKRWPCNFCEQVFNNPGNLGRHVRIVHEGIKDYECKYCDKAFGKAETRDHHQMTHTGEKPHVCKICHKSFIQMISLQKHMKRHNKATEVISEALTKVQ